jgi:hypothetical protein
VRLRRVGIPAQPGQQHDIKLCGRGPDLGWISLFCFGSEMFDRTIRILASKRAEIDGMIFVLLEGRIAGIVESRREVFAVLGQFFGQEQVAGVIQVEAEPQHGYQV